MRNAVSVMLALAMAAPGAAQTTVMRKGYVRSDGVYVPPSYSTKPDGNPYNNYSTKGNINPYTGQRGTVDPYGSTYSNPYRAPSYGSGYSQPSRPSWASEPSDDSDPFL